MLLRIVRFVLLRCVIQTEGAAVWRDSALRRKGVVIEQQCKAAGISGFPTWIIDGKSYEGDQTFDQLAEASGFQQ
jgi:2-hydroxychromene-2-carboxylate isomerase